MRKVPLWWELPSAEMCIGASAKCGSSTLITLAAKMGVIPGTTRPEYRDSRHFFSDLDPDFWKVAIVRHPVSRMLSAWKDKIRDGNTGTKRFKELAGVTPDEFWESVRDDILDDAHTLPQEFLADRWETLVVVPLDRLDAWWDDHRPLGAPALTRERVSGNGEPARFSEPVAEEIKKMYARDLALWTRAMRDTTRYGAYPSSMGPG